ncbi:MAG: hypothetical protein IJ808_08575 [Muribaculaceae bacterium]|nr:hypothetical protein [Muribaculaceae bacterium]
MKKKLFLSLVAVLALVAVAQTRQAEQLARFLGASLENGVASVFSDEQNAEFASVQVNLKGDISPEESSAWHAGTVPTADGAHKARRASLNGGLASKSYAEIDYDANNARTARCIVNVLNPDDGTMSIVNLWNMGDTISGTYDAATGTISIKPQVVYHHSTYGDIWLCSVNFDSHTYDYQSSAVIAGQVGEDGSLSITNWGLFVVEGQYKNASFTSNRLTEFKPTNATAEAVIVKSIATATDAEVDSTTTYDVYIDQTVDNEVNIMNFANNGATVTVMLEADGTANIPQQTLFTNLFYGEFVCAPATIESRVTFGKGYIPATANTTSLSVGIWGIYSSAASVIAQLRRNTVFNYKEGVVTLPAVKTLDWGGTGTESDPFLITTPDQLEAFAASVNTGTTYAGQYVALGADIDMSNRPGAYRPVGMFAEKTFKGTFDGKGHTVKNLTVTMKGNATYAGMIGQAGEGSLITNLVMENTVINTSGDYSAPVVAYTAGTVTDVTVTNANVTSRGSYSGGAVGMVADGSVSGVKTAGSINGYGGTGGVVGYVQRSSVTSCSSSATVQLTSLSNTMYRGVGGVIGNAVASQVSKCWFSGLVNDRSSYGYAGGVMGGSVSDTITSVFNVGQVLTNAPRTTSASVGVGAAGGVLGEMFGSWLTDSYNSNVVMDSQASERVGGLVGYVGAPSSAGTYASKIERCYNSGQVMLPTPTATMGLYGVCNDVWGNPNDEATFTDCYYDVQVNGYVEDLANGLPAYAKYTADMITSKGLDGFTTAKWTFTAGQYPLIKGMTTTTAARLSAAPLQLSEGETSKKVKRDFTVSTNNSVAWRVLDENNQPVTETEALAINGKNVTLKQKNATQMLVASNDSFKNLLKFVTIETVNPMAFAGSGTIDDPYQIRTKADLISLNETVVDFGQDYMGDYFVQTNDIDLELDESFEGIGTATLGFGGTYDGQGYAIHRFKLSGVALDASGKAVVTGSVNNAALFRMITTTGTLRNLVMASDCEFYGWSNMAPFAVVNNGRIENCRNYADVTAMSSYVAGIAAGQNATGVITGCYNAGTITTGNNYAAGVVANNRCVIENCQNNGVVHGTMLNQPFKEKNFNYVAGIVSNNAGNVTVTGNLNAGTIIGDNYVAGITTNVGTSTASTLARNINYGIIDFHNVTKAEHGAIGAATLSENIVSEDNYFDSQIAACGGVWNGPAVGVKALLTKQLVAGQPLAGIDENALDLVQGQYPVLAAFKNEPAAQAHRQMVVTFADDETHDDLVTKASLNDAQDLSWAIRQQNFAIQDGGVSINVTGAPSSVRDTLVATMGDFSKAIPLRAMSPTAFDGAGTEEDPYQIATVADMQKLARLTGEELFPFTGRHFKVMNDIDFTGDDYQPVAVDPSRFDAEFNGDGKTFKGVRYVLESGVVEFVSLFMNVGEHGYIHHLTLEGDTLCGYSSSAGFVGRLYGRVEDCENRATITTTKSGTAAGIVARVFETGSVSRCVNKGIVSPAGTIAAGIAAYVLPGASITECVNEGDVTANKNNAGGIAYYSAGIIKDCVNRGTITGGTNVAGIVSTSHGGDSIVRCVNEGAIIPSGNLAAGIVATGTKSDKNTVVVDCYNTADIETAYTVGGVAGKLFPGAVVRNCYNTGNISSSNATAAGFIIEVDGDRDSVKATILEDCYNLGDVLGKNSTGGFASDLDTNVDIYRCYNTGNVMATGNYSAAFCARLSGNAYDCYNTGNIEADGYGIGGIGGIGTGHMVRCVNVGNVTAGGNGNNGRYGNAGGIFGYGNCVIEDCYNMGTVTAPCNVGGLIAHAIGYFPELVMRRSYNAGEIVASSTTLVGGIIMTDRDDLDIDSCYYDSELVALGNPYGPQRAPGQGNVVVTRGALTTSQMTQAALGDAFIYQEGMYPVLKSFAGNELFNWFAATPVMAQGDTWENVTQVFAVGCPEATEWTTSSNLRIDAGKVYTLALGDAWMTKTWGDYSKTYKLYVNQFTSLNGTKAESGVAKVEYVDLAGRRSNVPFSGVNIVVTTHADGTVTTVKKVLE